MRQSLLHRPVAVLLVLSMCCEEERLLLPAYKAHEYLKSSSLSSLSLVLYFTPTLHNPQHECAD